MKRDTLRFHYGNSWLMAALVVFLLLCIIVLLRGSDFQPVPPPSKGFVLMPPGAVSTLQPNWQGPIQPQEPYHPPTNEIHSINWESTNDSGYLLFRVEAQSGYSMQVSTNNADWMPIGDDPCYSKEIVGYSEQTSTNPYPRLYFRAVPK